MLRRLTTGLLIALAATFTVAADDARPVVIVTIENMAPTNGTFQTPVWIGFHNGEFDSYDGGTLANTLPLIGSDGLERLAEDGTTGPISADFSLLAPDGTQSTVLSNGPIPPFGPGQRASRLFDANPESGRYFSYVSMVIPSNDAFVANGSPTAHPIFDANGRFVAEGFVVAGNAVNDAGTEANDEIPANTAFFGQAAPNVGVVTEDPISDHVGFLPAGSGGILDAPNFANADFLSDGYNTLRFAFRYLDANANLNFDGTIDEAQEIPMPTGDNDAAGRVQLKLRENGTVLRFQVNVRDLSGPLAAAHLHVAPAGQTGPVVVDLLANASRQNNGSFAGEVTVADVVGPLANDFDALLAELATGGIYVNLHTDLNPAGEARGQLYLRNR